LRVRHHAELGKVGHKMKDTRERLTPTTVWLHWAVAAVMLGMIAFGMYAEELPKGPGKSALIGLHKAIGVVFIPLAAARLAWRWNQGFPPYLSDLRAWEKAAAKGIHMFLIFATVAIPLAGMVMSIGAAKPINVFGLFTIPALAEPNTTIRAVGGFLHAYISCGVIAVVLVHVAGALKHELADRDGTFRRILGLRATADKPAVIRT
jgi:cytochrome b561